MVSIYCYKEEKYIKIRKRQLKLIKKPNCQTRRDCSKIPGECLLVELVKDVDEKIGKRLEKQKTTFSYS